MEIEETEYQKGFLDCLNQTAENNKIMMSKPLQLLKQCLDKFEYLFDINWGENSCIQSSDFEDIKSDIEEYLDNLEQLNTSQNE